MRKRKPPTLAPQSETVVDQHLTIPEVAAKLQVARTTVYKFINQEGLPVVDIAGIRRVSSSSLKAWLAAHQRIRPLS